MITTDFHTHTMFSADSLSQPKAILAAARRTGIDRVVITDHNTIEGGLAAVTIDPLHFIVGEEIMTSDGEILAAFVQETIPPGLTPVETIARLREQGAFISVSHPFDFVRGGHWELADLEAIAPLIDAVEGFNARCYTNQFNRQAQDFARRHHLLMTAGSDAHATSEIGAAGMLTPEFQNAEELREALKQAQLRAHISPPWVHFFSRYAKWRKKLLKDRKTI